MPLLQIQSGKHRGKTIRLKDGAIVIGRGDSADMRIASAEISREHCCIRVSGDEVFVCDLGSANGTFINGNEIPGVTRPDDLTLAIPGEMPLPLGGHLHVGPMAFQLIDPTKPIPKLPTKSGKAPASSRRRKVAAAVLNAKAKAKKDAAQAASEDDALAWLTEDVPNPASESEDMSIMTAEDVAEADPKADDADAVPPPSKAQFDSIAEEAADIFRRHLLMQQRLQEQAESAG